MSGRMAGAARTPVGPAERREEGTTLVELLVVMVLTTIVLAAVGTVFTSSLRGVREAQVRTSTQADARTATEAITRSLRVAVAPPAGAPTGPSSGTVPSPFTAASSTGVSFYANLQRTTVAFATSGPTSAPVVRAALEGPWLVSYGYDATRQCVTEARTPATANTGPTATTVPYLWTTGTTTKCLATTTTPPSFSYFTSGVITSAAGATAPIAPASGSTLSPAEAASVVSVGVALVVADPRAPDLAPTTTSDRVSLVNVLASQAG
ncbi:PilW family protein [Quadrisphaera sp. KR29]|uniref:PilW family protein n=1 Tax=Quadrisphaera sp. KR29 TaxID=3461391 RepID=UPI0040447921